MASVNPGGATKAMLFVKSGKPSDCLERFDRVAIQLREDRATGFRGCKSTSHSRAVPSLSCSP